MQQWCVPGPVLLVDSGYAVQETGLSTALEGLRGDGEERIIEEVYIYIYILGKDSCLCPLISLIP